MAKKEDPNPQLGAEAEEHIQALEDQVMTLIRDKIDSMGWSQEDAARVMYTHQPKVSVLTRKENPTNPLSLAKLLQSAYRIGIRVNVEVTPKYRSDSYPTLPEKVEKSED